MTLKEWELMIKGARHSRLDKLEDLRLQAVMYARMTNGKDIKDINRNLEKERALINQSETSYEVDQKKKKWERKQIRKIREKAMQEWIDERNKTNRKE
ncbi:hypothetical protein [Macrococcus animalis]|uniref:hypothetical protein n=1 Tax=Macrococcus animalis TaxID=3395467 RepID=UPI0039BEA4C1